MKTDDWFKPLLLLLIIIFLIIFYGHTQNGRYVLTKWTELDFAAFDSRTGALYLKGDGKSLKVDYPSGKITTSPIQKNDPSSK